MHVRGLAGANLQSLSPLTFLCQVSPQVQCYTPPPGPTTLFMLFMCPCVHGVFEVAVRSG